MASLTSDNIREKIEELARLLLLRDEVPNTLIDKVIRHIRPASSSSSLSTHTTAVKTRIRQSLLNHAAGSDGPATVAIFEKECEKLRKIDSSLLHPFLAFLEPLSFPEGSKNHFNTFKSSSSSSSSIQEYSSTVISTDSFGNNISVNAKEILFPLAPPLQVSEKDAEALDVGFAWINKQHEHKLLRDLIYIFQGIGGKHIKYDTRTESYVIDPALKLRAPARDATLCLCELGWLYTKVANYIQKAEGIDTSKGLIVQAFGFALQEELHDYYRLLAVLEQELNRKTNKPDHDTDTGTSGLTLLRLRAWMQEPLDRMFLMARLVDGAGPLIGGALASRLHGHALHGDPAVQQIVQRMMDSVCTPLYTILSRWVLHGELYDPFEEFFVGSRVGVPANSMWQETYFLRPSMLPSFFSPSLAQKILVIGKSINFIRACIQKLPKNSSSKSDDQKRKVIKRGMKKITVADALGYGQENLTSYDEGNENFGKINEIVKSSSADEVKEVEVDDRSENVENDVNQLEIDNEGITGATVDVEESLNALRYGGELRLAELVYKIASSTDSKLLHMLEHKFHLNSHLLALKKFMLLGQGDFVTCLMDSVGPELKKRANQLYRHNLTGVLEGALRSSNAQFEPAFVLDRIGVRLLEASPGDSGWEVFSLDYAVDTPLNAVVHHEAISRYRMAFHMLWRLKRVEWSLSGAWKQLMSFSHTRGNDPLPKLRPVLHRCTLHRGRMLHVINNLCAFLMFEVMESAWVTLQEGLNRARCMDDVINAHDAYLAEILDRALLGQQHEELNMQVQQMLQSILRFCSLEESLVADAMAAMSRRRAARAEGEERSKKGGWGVSDRVLEEAPGSYDGVPAYLITRLDEAVRDYSGQFDLLMAMLKEQGEKAGEILRFLTFRLDFNDYHAKTESYKRLSLGTGGLNHTTSSVAIEGKTKASSPLPQSSSSAAAVSSSSAAAASEGSKTTKTTSLAGRSSTSSLPPAPTPKLAKK